MSTRLPYVLIVALLFILLVGCQSADVAPSATASQEEVDAPDSQITPTAAESEVQEPSSPWVVVHEVHAEHRPGFVLFTQPENPSFGITSCKSSEERPHPYITTDGGQSWSKSGVYNVSCPFGMAVAEADLAWTCNDRNVWSSEDEGQKWNQLAFPVGLGPCKLLSFLDAENGWAASTKTLMGTRDGGSNWEAIALPEGVRKIAAISLSTPEIGYVLDANLSVYRTANGGRDWSTTHLEIEDSDLDYMELGAAIGFLDDMTGVVILNLAGGGKSALMAFHTKDGGQTWEQHVVPIGLGPVSLSREATYLTATPSTEPGVIYILENLSQP